MEGHWAYKIASPLTYFVKSEMPLFSFRPLTHGLDQRSKVCYVCLCLCARVRACVCVCVCITSDGELNDPVYPREPSMGLTPSHRTLLKGTVVSFVQFRPPYGQVAGNVFRKINQMPFGEAALTLPAGLSPAPPPHLALRIPWDSGDREC